MPRIECPADDDCVLGAALARRAREQPQRRFVVFADGVAWTFSDAYLQACRRAHALGTLGVRPRDAVLVWLPNGAEMLRCWFGTNLAGAVFIPVNTAYRGALLQHVLDNAQAGIAFVHVDLLPLLAEVRTAALRTVVVVGAGADDAPAATLPGIELMRLQQLADGEGGASGDALPRMRPWDLQAVVYTSGTTGPSKGVLTSYLHLASMATGGRDMVTDRDHRLVQLPLFHAGGMQAVLGMLLKGGSLHLGGSFRTDTFWDTVRSSGATTVNLLGAMIGFLMKAPVDPREREHGLRSAFLVPMPADGLAFGERFGVDVYTNYNSSETSNPLVSARNPAKLASCGRPRAGVQARVVDEYDFDVPDGECGELLLRTDLPWGMSHGYRGDPVATADAWRNGWFHTGELFRRDADGDFHFVDRIKDAIRRRGENISSFEVERELLTHAAVLEAAVIGIESAFGESDVLAAVVPRPGSVVDPAALIEHLRPRLAHFMIPRYLRVVDALPRTGSHKVQKHLLRAEGVTTDTWDREAAGVQVRAPRLG